jgi:hypothetical protein
MPSVRFRVSHEFHEKAVVPSGGDLSVEYQVNGAADE